MMVDQTTEGEKGGCMRSSHERESASSQQTILSFMVFQARLDFFKFIETDHLPSHDREPCSRLKPSYEFRSEGLSNFSP